MELDNKQVMKITKRVIIGLLVLIVLLGSFTTVDAGKRGIKKRLGSVVSVLEPGLNFKLPFIEEVVEIDVQTQKEQVSTSAASSDLQNVSAVIAVNFNVQADEATLPLRALIVSLSIQCSRYN